MRFGDQKQMKYWGLGGWWIIIIKKFMTKHRRKSDSLWESEKDTQTKLMK